MVCRVSTSAPPRLTTSRGGSPYLTPAGLVVLELGSRRPWPSYGRRTLGVRARELCWAEHSAWSLSHREVAFGGQVAEGAEVWPQA